MIGSVINNINDGKINKHIAAAVAAKLREKYNRAFTVYAMGKQFGPGGNTVTAYCYPSEDKTNIFTAMLDSDKTNLKDNYVQKSVCKMVERILISGLNEIGIISKANIDIFMFSHYTNETVHLPLSDILKDNSGCVFYGFLVIQDKAYALKILTGKVKKALNKIKNTYPGLAIVLNIAVLKVEDYTVCTEEMDKRPAMSKSFIKRFMAVHTFKYLG